MEYRREQQHARDPGIDHDLASARVAQHVPIAPASTCSRGDLRRLVHLGRRAQGVAVAAGVRRQRPEVRLEAVEVEHEGRRRQRIAGIPAPRSAARSAPRFASSLVTHPPPALNVPRVWSSDRAISAPGRNARSDSWRPRSAGPCSEVETPVAVVDLDRLEANLRRLQSYADEHGIALWPHTKTHKSPEIGLRQLEIGAGGLTVAKTGEAEVFHEAGVPRCSSTTRPSAHDKWERLARLAADGLELTVAVDGIAAAEGLSTALGRHGARGAFSWSSTSDYIAPAR